MFFDHSLRMKLIPEFHGYLSNLDLLQGEAEKECYAPFLCYRDKTVKIVIYNVPDNTLDVLKTKLETDLKYTFEKTTIDADLDKELKSKLAQKSSEGFPCLKLIMDHNQALQMLNTLNALKEVPNTRWRCALI